MRRLALWLVWWVGLAAVWMLLVDTVSLAELLSCAGTAAIATFATEIVRRQGVAPLAGPVPTFVRMLPRQLARVPLDLWLLAVELGRAAAGRHPAGRVHVLAFGGGGSHRENSRRAAIELLGSLAPNTIVLGVDEDQVVLHQLRAHPRERQAIEELGR